jgi:hypothetical protein
MCLWSSFASGGIDPTIYGLDSILLSGLQLYQYISIN